MSKGLILVKSVGLFAWYIERLKFPAQSKREKKEKAVTCDSGFDLTAFTCASSFADLQRLISCG